MSRKCLGLVIVLMTISVASGDLYRVHSEECKHVFDHLSHDPKYSYFVAALNTTNIPSTILMLSNLTVFAPTNDAFVEMLDQDKQVLDMDLYDLLRYHIMIGPKLDRVGNQIASTLYTEAVTISKSNDQLVVNGVLVKNAKDACNGQVLEIDEVLSPMTTTTALDVATPIATPISTQCLPGQCCDIPSPGDFKCEDQANWGKCKEQWMIDGGYCRESCGRCSVAADKNASIVHDHQSAYVKEGVLYQQWTGLSGSKISDFKKTSKFAKRKPDYSIRLQGKRKFFMGPPSRSSIPDSGARLSGYFCAPMSGMYQFFISSDDSSRLYIGSSPSEPLEKIAKVDSWQRRGQWQKAKRKIELKKGTSYFLEALHKNGGHVGHVEVGLRMPNGVDVFPIPADMFTASCSSVDNSTLPIPMANEACACTKNGFTGTFNGGSDQIDTGYKGCNSYISSEPADDFGLFGKQLGERLGQYLNQEWGWSDDASKLLGGWWREGATALAASTNPMNVNICYVKHPAFCPLAQPSAVFSGAAYKLCD